MKARAARRVAERVTRSTERGRIAPGPRGRIWTASWHGSDERFFRLFGAKVRRRSSLRTEHPRSPRAPTNPLHVPERITSHEVLHEPPTARTRFERRNL